MSSVITVGPALVEVTKIFLNVSLHKLILPSNMFFASYFGPWMGLALVKFVNQIASRGLLERQPGTKD